MLVVCVVFYHMLRAIVTVYAYYNMKHLKISRLNLYCGILRNIILTVKKT